MIGRVKGRTVDGRIKASGIAARVISWDSRRIDLDWIILTLHLEVVSSSFGPSGNLAAYH